MLRITKGLKPYIEDGISTYTDAKGNQYVRVKEDDEDFCIAAHDLTKNDKDVYFNWDKAMEMLKDKGLTTFTKEQAALYNKYHNEINHKLKEIGGEALRDESYWTITEVDTKHARCFQGEGDDNSIDDYDDYQKDIHINVRPIINL